MVPGSVSLPSIDEAVIWLKQHQDDRTAPAKLHYIETENQGELGSPRFTPSFLRYLYARSNDVDPDSEIPVDCPDMAWNCPVCSGAGFYTVVRERYRYPMWRAFSRLKDRKAIRPGHPAPIECIVALIKADYSWQEACRYLRVNPQMGEALLLMAIRSLNGLYELGPTPRQPKWTELSSAQQNAIVSGEVA